MQPSATRSESPAIRLPNLLYIGDVPVESSYHGSALLFRLLQNWPPEALRIIETNLFQSQSERRLPGVCYELLRLGWRRPLYTRFARWYRAWLSWIAARRVSGITPLLGNFEPQAIVTVTHGFSWRTAASFARQRGLPLHLICHDDLPRLAFAPQPFTRWLDRQFGLVYRSAASRLCVSPFMREAYRARYGCDGTILYPSRAANCPVFEAPPERLIRNDHPFTVAFAGNIVLPGYMRALQRLRSTLDKVDGRLLLFAPISVDTARRNGLADPKTVFCGLVGSGELMKRFREEVDVLYVPMSFDSADRPNMEASFPSKLTDYTAVGLPILIHGPNYCSAVQWARENRGVAEVVDNANQDQLAGAIERLAYDPVYRMTLAARALEVGERFFSHRKAWEVFYGALVNISG